MLAHQLRALQIMVFGKELIKLLDLLGWNRPHNQTDQNLLFIWGRLAETGEFFFHAQQLEKNAGGLSSQIVQPILPQKFAATQRRALGQREFCT